MTLRGVRILVTGAGSGVGRAVAVCLAREGADLVITGRSAAPLRDTSNRLERDGQAATSIRADLSKPNQVKRLFRAASHRKPVKHVVHCAFGHIGEDRGASLLDVSAAALEAFAKDSILASWHVAREAARPLRKHAGRLVVIVADWGLPQHNVFLAASPSKAGKLGSEAFASAKYAIAGLVNTAEPMLGIGTSGIYPGIIASSIPSKSTAGRVRYFDIDDDDAAIAAEEAYSDGWAIPLRDVANAVLFCLKSSAVVKLIGIKPRTPDYDGLHI